VFNNMTSPKLIFVGEIIDGGINRDYVSISSSVAWCDVV
jgi:hypothetical protein